MSVNMYVFVCMQDACMYVSFKFKPIHVYICVYMYISVHIYIYVYLVIMCILTQIFYRRSLRPRAPGEDIFVYGQFSLLAFPRIHRKPRLLSRRREHLHARALQIRAELSTHIHRETGPQRPTHSFWSFIL